MTRIRSRRRAHTRVETLAGDERTNLVVGRGVACDWTEAERRACWAAVGEELAARSPAMRRPAAWWEYEPGIPAELREAPHRNRSALLAVLGASRPAQWPRDTMAGYQEAQRRRAAFLVTAGHLRPGEADHIRRAAATPRDPEHADMVRLLPLLTPDTGGQ